MRLHKKSLEDRFKARIDSRRAEREAKEASTAEHKARMRAVNEAYWRTKIGFWCKHCQRDYNLIGYKHRTDRAFDVDRGVMVPVSVAYPEAWYSATCPEGHTVYRLITDKHRDPYYRLSKAVQFERSILEDDLLQPSDPRFKYVYPDAWRKLNNENDNGKTT